jgi:hypothetical protein
MTRVARHGTREGNVLVGAIDDPEGETLVLARLSRLSPKALAAARREALRLNARGYRLSDVYRRTPPARRG